MVNKSNVRSLFSVGVLVIMCLAFVASAKQVPAELPDPDGKPGDATKPVKVYILAGQSNMVGFGRLSGAKNSYDAIYLTADGNVPKGQLNVFRGGNYKIDELVVSDAEISVYEGAYDAGVDYDKAKPVMRTAVDFGVTGNDLSFSDEHTCVIRAVIEVPETASYVCSPGYMDSSYNVMTLDGKEVYRRDAGESAVREKVTLEKGKSYPVKITFLKGGSTAFWMSQVDLQGMGDLETITKREGKFPWMIDDDGNWTVRNDVWYQEVRLHDRGCPLSATSNDSRHVGPEVPFGYVMGEFHDEQVLLIESSQGNRSLSQDFRPPSSGRTDPESKWEGLEYRLMVEGVHKTLDNIDKIVPGYKGQGYEIAGFVWWQGHKDRGQSKAEYEKHLVNLIEDVRKEFDAPKMKAVVASVGFDGYNINEDYAKIHAAQMAVGDPEQHPEFAGKVKSIDTRGFWRERDESPTGTGYHYNHNAETYMLTGDALGRAMVELQGGEAEALGYGNRPESEAKKPTEKKELTQAEKKAGQKALEPIIIDGMLKSFISEPGNQSSLLLEMNSERAKRENQFLRSKLYAVNNYYKAAGIEAFSWHNFGPNLADVQWDYYSFDPPEKLERDRPGRRYREVTYPDGMDKWFAADFDAKKSGWKSGLPPFGNKGGKLEAFRGCKGSPCGCGVVPRTLWENEVILIRKTIDVPPLKDDCRYRIVIGGSNHIKTGEGYAVYVDGKLLYESKSGVPNRQGGQPRGAYVYKDFRDDFKDGKVTIAVKSFLRYGVRSGAAPQGHLTVWLEEQKLPLVKTSDGLAPVYDPPATTSGIIDVIQIEPPKDSVVLVGDDGYDLIPEKDKVKCLWKFEDGVLTASPKWDSLITKKPYKDFRMHVEFNVNDEPDAKPEGNGNSGVYIQQRYEIQILNSYGVSEEDYKASYNGSLYRMKKPDKIVCKPAGQWQSYDIAFRAARFDGDEKVENARITVYHNGELVHDDFSIPRKTGAGKREGPEPRPIKLQGHHNEVKFRNVWIQELNL